MTFFMEKMFLWSVDTLHRYLKRNPDFSLHCPSDDPRDST